MRRRPEVDDLLGNDLALAAELERIAGRKVDLVMSDAVENHYFAAEAFRATQDGMEARAAALLWDVVTAVQRIQGLVADKAWEDYADDLLLRSGVERRFEIAGEALSVLRRHAARPQGESRTSTGSSACATS